MQAIFPGSLSTFMERLLIYHSSLNKLPLNDLMTELLIGDSVPRHNSKAKFSHRLQLGNAHFL